LVHQSRHKATIDTPPTDLAIEDVRPHSGKKVVVQPPASQADPIQMTQQMMRMFMGGLTGSMALTCSPEKHSLPVTPFLSASDTSSSPPASLKCAADNILTPRNIDMEIWLAQLDLDPIHGEWNINYSQLLYSWQANFRSLFLP